MVQKHEGNVPITLTMPPDFSEVQFYALTNLNKGIRIEKDSQGKLVIMSLVAKRFLPVHYYIE